MARRWLLTGQPRRRRRRPRTTRAAPTPAPAADTTPVARTCFLDTIGKQSRQHGGPLLGTRRPHPDYAGGVASSSGGSAPSRRRRRRPAGPVGPRLRPLSSAEIASYDHLAPDLAARVRVVRHAPLGDPIELRLRNYALSIGREEASRIDVEPLPTPVLNPAAR